MNPSPVHKGVVRDGFQHVYGPSHLSFHAGQALSADDGLKASLVSGDAPVAWAADAVEGDPTASEPVAAPLLSFDAGDGPMTQDVMQPGVIYAVERFDKDAVRAAFDAGAISNVTLSSKRGDQAQRMQGYTLAG